MTGLLTRLDQTTGHVKIGGLGCRPLHRRLREGRVDAAVRPEALVVGDAIASGALRGTARRAADLGSRVEYPIGTGIGELFVTLRTQARGLRAESPSPSLSARTGSR